MTDFPKVKPQHMVILLGLVLAFYSIPSLPKNILILTDLFLVRFILLVLLLTAVSINPVLGIVSFVVLALLFVERNKAKMLYMESIMEHNDGSESQAITEIVSPETVPSQPPFEKPVSKSIPFMPEESSGDNTFHPVAPSMNEKQPLPTETSEGSDKAIKQLFGWVDPTLAQGSS